jgi:hypothetical protein
MPTRQLKTYRRIQIRRLRREGRHLARQWRDQLRPEPVAQRSWRSLAELLTNLVVLALGECVQ